MSRTPIFDALVAELLTAETNSDESAEVEDQPAVFADVAYRLNGHLE